MINLFQATSYRIKKSRVLFWTLLCSFLFPAAFTLVGYLSEGTPFEILRGTLDNVTFFLAVILLFFTVTINCNDFKGKTIYYEVMHGHSRPSIYRGRMLSILLFAEIAVHVCFLVGIGGISYLKGYSIFMDPPYQMFLKAISMELFYLSLLTYIVACTFIFRDMATSLVAGWVGCIVAQMVILLDDYISIFGKGIGYYVGFRVPVYNTVEHFSVSHFMVSSSISLIIVSVFYWIGVSCFKRANLH